MAKLTPEEFAIQNLPLIKEKLAELKRILQEMQVLIEKTKQLRQTKSEEE